MRTRITMVLLAAMTATCIIAFVYVLRQISLISVGLAAHDEIEQKLRESLEDQKKLAHLDPASAAAYRQRFESTRELMTHLHILALSRDEIMRRIELVLVAVVAFILAGATALYFAERSRVAAQHQSRMRYLEHLTSWQEAARRHAHEIRTPLTAAHMEVERLVAAARGGSAEEIAHARDSILEELGRIRQFTKSFTSFASVPKPKAERIDLQRLVTEFSKTFATAWPNLRLDVEEGGECVVSADSEMLRQVLVNLCNNSALAGAHAIAFRVSRNGPSARVDVRDDGPGIAPEIRGRLFEPYATTRGIGEGMGLGLAISKKILLDHGGDLELVRGGRGAAFRLTLPLENAA